MKRAATIAAKLDATGERIDQFDCLIAAVILSHGYSKIMTNNKKHFLRIEGLTVITY